MITSLSKQAKAQFGDYFGIDLFSIPRFDERLKKRKRNEADLYMADIHAPFHHREYVAKTIRDNEDCQKVWILGDIFDFYSRSFFRKKYDVSFAYEFREGWNVVCALANRFEEVNIMLTNHDQRHAKYIYDNVPKELLGFCATNLVEALLSLIKNVRIRKQKLNASKRLIEYLYQNGNVVFSHAELSASNVGLTVQKLEGLLQKWGGVYDLKPYDAIIQAHNHQSAKVRFGSKFLYQIPCLIDVNELAFDYVFNGKIMGNPPALGYIRAYKDASGKFDPINSHITDY